MADTVRRTIEVLFAGRDTGLTRTVLGIGQGIDSFGTHAASATTSLLKFNAGVAAVAAGGLVVATNEAANFSDGMNLVNTMAQTTGQSFEDFSKDILEYGKKSGFAYEEIQNATYNAISLGVDYGKSLEVVRAAEELAIGGKAELNDSLELLQGTMNAYGAEVEETGRYSDTFFTIVEQGKTTIPELAASMSELTGIASASNVPIEDVGAAIAAITSTGAPTSQAVTKIKAAFEAFLKPSTELTAALGGVTLQGDGLQAVMAQLKTATGGSSDKMAELFGSSEAVQAALTLANDSSGNFAKSLAAMDEKAGATDKAYQLMADNMDKATQQLENNVKATLISIGLNTLESGKNIVSGFTSIFQGLTDAIDAGSFDAAFELINEWGKDVATYLEGIAKALPEAFEGVDFSGLLQAIEDIKETLFTLFDDLDLTDSDDLQEAIQKIIETFETLVSINNSVIIALKPFIDKIIEIAIGFDGLDDNAKEWIGTIGGLSLVLVPLLAVLAPIVTALTTIGATGAVVIGSIAGITVTFVNLYEAIDKSKGLIENIANALNTIPTPAKLASEAIGFVADKLGILPGEKEIDVTVQDQIAVNKLKEFEKTINADLPNSKEISMELNTQGVSDDLSYISSSISEIELQKEIDINANWSDALKGIDIVQDKYEKVGEYANGNPIMMLVNNKDVSKKIDKTKKDLEKLPTEKLIEIQAQGDIDLQLQKIKSSAETMQTALEWKAKLDIENVKADMERFKVSVETLGNTIESAGSRIMDMYGGYDDASRSLQVKMDAQAAQEAKIQKESHAMQMKMLAVELERNTLLNDQIRSGKGGMHLTIEKDFEPIGLQMIKAFAELIVGQFSKDGFNLLYS